MSEYINRDDALNCFHDWVDKHGDVICADDTAEYIEIASLPSIELVRCKDCKYFEYDHVEKLDGIPLIVAHEICTRWSDGVKTSENGYCFLGERGDSDDD